VDWYKAWSPPLEFVAFLFFFRVFRTEYSKKIRFGSTVFSVYTLIFQTRLFSLLPASFSAGFKNLCACLLAPPSPPAEDIDDSFPVKSDSSAVIPTTPYCDPNIKATIWKNIEVLGLIDRYESIIASVGYEFIEDYVLKMCTGEWAKPMLEDLRIWMSEKVVPWMLHVYARGATNGLVSLLIFPPKTLIGLFFF
jgi:anaphase-promoting complex subunit 2